MLRKPLVPAATATDAWFGWRVALGQQRRTDGDNNQPVLGFQFGRSCGQRPLGRPQADGSDVPVSLTTPVVPAMFWCKRPGWTGEVAGIDLIRRGWKDRAGGDGSQDWSRERLQGVHRG